MTINTANLGPLLAIAALVLAVLDMLPTGIRVPGSPTDWIGISIALSLLMKK